MTNTAATHNIAPICRDAKPFEVERLGAKLGAEIHGIDLKQPLGRETFEAFEAELVENKVLVVRDQNLTTEQHVALSRLFGELEVHPMRPQGSFPEILVLDNTRTIRCCLQMCGIATQRSEKIQRSTPFCVAKSCRRSAATRCSPIWKRSMKG